MKDVISIFLTLVLSLLNLSHSNSQTNGEEIIKKVHKSNIPLVSSIYEHIVVSGDSHSGLWLGSGILFTPGHTPKDFHLFFTETDRKGGDSMQKKHYFKTPGLPHNPDSLFY